MYRRLGSCGAGRRSRRYGSGRSQGAPGSQRESCRKAVSALMSWRMPGTVGMQKIANVPKCVRGRECQGTLCRTIASAGEARGHEYIRFRVHTPKAARGEKLQEVSADAEGQEWSRVYIRSCTRRNSVVNRRCCRKILESGGTLGGDKGLWQEQITSVGCTSF